MEHPGSGPSTDQVRPRLAGSVDDWLGFVGARAAALGTLLRAPASEQDLRGYSHTLREIVQQPVTWIETAGRMDAHRGVIRVEVERLQAGGALILTGSGSSVYAGECLAPGLQAALGVTVRAVPAGEVLTHPDGYLHGGGPCLIVSFARSGNSPESCAVLDTVRDAEPQCRHLIVTCNRLGRLATSYQGDPRVSTVVLDDKTHDRSLVMTSSFTNMVLAARVLASLDDLARYSASAAAAALLGAKVLLEQADALAAVARGAAGDAVFLGSGCRFGSAREGALKMLEMTGGRVKTFPETFLGLRHGPMAAVGEDTLVVCFLSGEPVARAYEADLVRELGRKNLGARRVLVGNGVPAGLASPGDVVIDAAGLGLADEDLPVVDALVAQLLAFFRCLSVGLKPDMPSDEGIINRVVEDFAIHRRS